MTQAGFRLRALVRKLIDVGCPALAQQIGLAFRTYGVHSCEY